MIATFIFFDLETTGLISKCMPKITEMSLIAVSRNEIRHSMERLPRVLHKLVLPVNPVKCIPANVASLTKLSNEKLNHVKPFESETYELIISFIKRLQPPICFVAHNGNNFDYPIFLWELKNINKAFGKDILSIDTYKMFKDFFISEECGDVRQGNRSKSAPSTSYTSQDCNTIFDDGLDSLLCEAMDIVLLNDSNSNTEGTIVPKNLNSSKTKEQNNVAVGRSENVDKTPCTSCYQKIQKINEKTPEGQIIKSENTNKNVQDKQRGTARRRLDFTQSRPIDFKLGNVYKHIFQSMPENTHSAEGDCLTMLQCACQLGDYFVEWADNNATLFISHEKKLPIA